MNALNFYGLDISRAKCLAPAANNSPFINNKGVRRHHCQSQPCSLQSTCAFIYSHLELPRRPLLVLSLISDLCPSRPRFWHRSFHPTLNLTQLFAPNQTCPSPILFHRQCLPKKISSTTPTRSFRPPKRQPLVRRTEPQRKAT